MEQSAFLNYLRAEEKQEKIISLHNQPSDDTLDKHILSTKKTIQKVFGKELQKEEEKLPLIKWKECLNIPGAFSIFLLASAHRSREIHLFFHEMVSNWLVGEDPFQILSSRNLTFKVNEKKNRSYFFVEILIHVEKIQQLQFIKSTLPTLADEIRLGAFSSGYAKHILDMKRHSLGGKTSYVYETVVRLMRRHPKYFEHDVFRAIQRFFVHMREEFCDIRNVRHLSRLILTHYLFSKAIVKNAKNCPHKRHLYLKLFKTHLSYPFGLKKTLGIAITLNTISDYECFEQRHIIKALQRIILSTKIIPDSYYFFRDEENKLLSLYLEVEKNRSENFMLEELKAIRKILPQELKNSIEYLSPSLFVPRNEEELYRNIVILSQELKFVRDLPQAIISFKEQQGDCLKFDVILLRLLTKDSPSLQSMSHSLPPHCRFIPEKIAQVGQVRKKYPKEANVFSLEIESRLFLRKNHSIDLIRARQHVVKLVENLVGNFRDYNGGFLFKQNEQFEAIKKELDEKSKEHEFIIEKLFYSLNPSIMQTLIPPFLGKELIMLFLNTLDIDLPSQNSYHIEKKMGVDHVIIIVKIATDEMKDLLTVFLKTHKTGALKLAHAFLDVDGHHYACFLHLSPPNEETDLFSNGLEDLLQQWKKKQKNLQVIRVHLPRAAQSLDPRIGSDRNSGVVIKMLYEGLMRYTQNDDYEKGIAEHFEISSDKKRYTFHLRQAAWSNGSIVTSYDFEYAWKKILDPQFCFLYSFLFFGIKNARLAKLGQISLDKVGITTPNEKTLVIDLDEPLSYFLGLTAHWTYSPLCRDIDQRHPGWAYHSGDTYACNGPFKLDHWKLNDDLILVKNPLYWDANNVKLDKLEIRIVEDEIKALEMVKRGELDWIGDPITRIPPPALIPFKDSSFLHSENLSGFFWLQVNTESLPFRSATMRRAFSFAIDREKIIKKILVCDDKPAYGFYQRIEKTFYGNQKIALDLFEQGLKEIGVTRKKFPPILFTYGDIEEHALICREVGKQWEQAFGITVKYERVPWNTYFEELSKHSYMVGGLAWYSRYSDPIYYLDLVAQKDKVTKWQNARYQQLIFTAKHAFNEEREYAIAEAEAILLEEMPLIPLLLQKWRYLKNPRLKQVILSDTGQIDFRNAFLENE